MVYVIKADGSTQEFDKQKIIRTCLRMQATEEQARSIADKIEARAYDGIPTRKILEMIFFYLKKYRPALEHQIDLREAISLLRPKPDFEQYVGLLLKAEGYEVKQNLILQGKCIEHEIDAIAKKGDELIYVEVKHHLNHHTYTGLDVFLEVNSTFEDLKEGYELGLHPYKFTKALVVCNTKASEHAKKYAKCRGIDHIGWRHPEGRALEDIIETHKLYPITMIKGMEPKIEAKLADSGIITVSQLIEAKAKSLSKQTGLSVATIENLKEKAVSILS